MIIRQGSLTAPLLTKRMYMKVLYLKEEKTNKPDMMGCAIMDTFSQSNDNRLNSGN